MHENWQRQVRSHPGYLESLPNRPAGYLPTYGTNSGWAYIRDYPQGELTSGLKDIETARKVAWAYYTRHQYTRDTFLELLLPREMEEYARRGADYLSVLAVSKYLSTLEGSDLGLMPNDGTPSGTSAYIAPGFTKLWLETPIIITATPFRSDGYPASTEGERLIVAPSVPVAPQQALLLLL